MLRFDQFAENTFERMNPSEADTDIYVGLAQTLVSWFPVSPGPCLSWRDQQKGRGVSEVPESGLDPEILSLRVWRLYAQHLTEAKQVPIEELGAPVFSC